MNKNTLAVLAVIVALLAGWMVMKNLNAPSASVNMPEASAGLTGGTGTPASDGSDSNVGNDTVKTSIDVKDNKIKTSITVE